MNFSLSANMSGFCSDSHIYGGGANLQETLKKRCPEVESEGILDQNIYTYNVQGLMCYLLTL